MFAGSDTPQYLAPLLGVAVIFFIISRLVRIARYNAPTDTPPATPTVPRRPLWGPERKLQKLQQDTALTRAEVELLSTTGEVMQARHNLNRLKVELEPPPAPRRQDRATDAVPALTVPEIRAVLNALELAPELRTTILELVEATANEKVRQ